MPEVPALYDWMTVAEIGWFAAGFHPDPGGRHGALPGPLPGPGRRVRAARRAGRSRRSRRGCGRRSRWRWPLAADPALLILDEPTSGLDVLVRREFLESMVDLAGVGPDGPAVEPPDRRGRAGRQPRRADAQGQAPAGRAARRPAGADVPRLADVHQPRPPRRARPTASALELIDAADAPRQAVWLVHARDRAACEAVAGAAGGRVGRGRDAEPRRDLHRLHAFPAAAAPAAALAGGRGVMPMPDG